MTCKAEATLGQTKYTITQQGRVVTVTRINADGETKMHFPEDLLEKFFDARIASVVKALLRRGAP